ncbi:helix-turn-helix domain-containing protein [Pedobacter nutrimenti]|uniref:Helix-turn-helix protein n=1 Tax=Pedobacter nutrimenti TaxID=1241337 RepID=A0A318UEJ1_9SPHI|nr:helix-turn-helix domain-containing protein [Pedobacter nutrimenti]PYF74824.1 helix-turn-helix protein [Pedobacter nutrimenti]
MQHQEFEAPEVLRDIIKCFWYNRRESEELHLGFEVIPDGYAEIIFHFGNTLQVAHRGELQTLPSPFMMGLLNQPVPFYAKDRLEIIGVRCFPWAVFDLLGLPTVKGEVHLFEHAIADVQVALIQYIETGQIKEAMNLIKAYFLDLRSKVASNSVLFKAGKAMRESKGTMPVKQVAIKAHATVRTLERNFKQSSGYTVKDVSGLMRFEQVRNRLWHYPDSNLASLAAELGYTDQSHLSREFKRYCGTTPAAFARKAIQRKLITDRDFVAFIQA